MAAAAALAACGAAPEPTPPAPPAPPPSAEEQLTKLERDMLASDRLVCTFRTTSKGAVASNFDGSFRITKHAVQVTYNGAFAGEPRSGTLHGSKGHLGLESNTRTWSRGPAKETRESILIGLTRMGLLHNLAMLQAGAPPDHVDGGVRDWVEVKDCQRRDAHTIEFDIFVDGTPSGHAVLHFDPDTGLPSKREQQVDFGPGNTMSVVEEYRFADGAFLDD